MTANMDDQIFRAMNGERTPEESAKYILGQAKVIYESRDLTPEEKQNARQAWVFLYPDKPIPEAIRSETKTGTDPNESDEAEETEIIPAKVSFTKHGNGPNKRFPNGYITVPNEWKTRLPDVGPDVFAIYCVIFFWENWNTHISEVAYSTIRDITGFSKETISFGLKTLKALGWITGRGVGRSGKYRIETPPTDGKYQALLAKWQPEMEKRKARRKDSGSLGELGYDPDDGPVR